MTHCGASRGPRSDIRELLGSIGPATLLTTLRREAFSVLYLETPAGLVVVKLARTEAHDRPVQDEYERLGTLPSWTGIAVPRPLAFGRINGRAAAAMTAVPGVKLLLAPALDDRLRAAADAVADQIAGAVHDGPVDAGEIRDAILAAAGSPAAAAGDGAVAPLIAAAVRAHQRAGRRRVAEWTHNDFTGVNVFVDDGRIGVIDWGLATPRGFARVDRLALMWHLLVKREGVAPDAAVQRIKQHADDPDRRAAAIALFAILGTRGFNAGQPARTAVAAQAISALETL